MNDTYKAMINRHPGRPPKTPIKKIAAKILFWDVARQIGTTTGYGVEKHLHPEIFKVKQEPIKRPCRYDKYKTGKHFPSEERLDQINETFPGTKKLALHPFFALAEPHLSNTTFIYDQLRMLRPDIVNALFCTTCETEVVSHVVQRETLDATKSLDREADLDALAGCIGLIQEFRYLDFGFVPPWYTRTTYRVLLRLLCQPPFSDVADELYQYIWKHFLQTERCNNWYQKIQHIDIQQQIINYRFLLKLIKDTKALKYNNTQPQRYLFIAEKYYDEDLSIICTPYWAENRGLKELKKLPKIKNMLRSIRYWEKKELAKTHFDTHQTGQ